MEYEGLIKIYSLRLIASARYGVSQTTLSGLFTGTLRYIK